MFEYVLYRTEDFFKMIESFILKLNFKRIFVNYNDLAKKIATMEQFYMIEFDLPEVMAAEFIELLPKQRQKVDELMMQGRLHSYSLAENKSRLWMVVVASSEFEVLTLIDELPLSQFMIPSMTKVAFHHSMKTMTSLQLN
jgi:hypothetical protein